MKADDMKTKAIVACVCGVLGASVIVTTGAALRAHQQQPAPQSQQAPQPQQPEQRAIAVEAPGGGWNVSGLVDDSEKIAVAYPPSPIDRGAQKYRTLIRGRLAAVNNDRPHRLIVNGNPMPLYVGEDGRFARPYAFGVGSNSIEVRSPDGKQKQRIQFYEANPAKTPARVRVVLGWDDNQADVDLHLITPDGQHAFWADPVLSNGGGLDVDSVDGAGPEMFSSVAPLRGVYYVYVNYWGNFGPQGYHFDESTRKQDVITTTVTIILNENSPKEKRETFMVPLRKIGDLTLVRSFVY
jgi:uncharacterized protein YfaP (DUF2135 family)